MLIPFSGKMTLNFSINLILYFFINLILTFTILNKGGFLNKETLEKYLLWWEELPKEVTNHDGEYEDIKI